MIKKKILIATGGTGGHVFPAYSLASYLIKKKYNIQLTTDKRGLRFLKDSENFSLINIPSSPFIKKNLLKFLLSILTILYAILKSFLILIFNRPTFVFGMGGYSSFPVCIAAFFLKIKFVVYENNLIIGKANRYLIPFAEKIFVSYEDLEGVPEKYSRKVFKIGNLVREEIINKRSLIDEKNKFNKLEILVLGGSQAAKVFAEELPPIFQKIKNSKLPIKVYQQCQKKQNGYLSEFYKKAKIDFELFNFTDKIINYYSKVNMAITRSGASVLGELVNFKIPFISIPLPTSADNHQFKNAEFYRKRAYGYVIEEKDIKNNLYDLIKLIFKDKSLLNNIVLKQKKYSDKTVFSNLYTQLEKLLDEKN